MLTSGERFALVACVAIDAIAIITAYASPSTGTNILKDLMVFLGGAGIAYVFAVAGARATSNQAAEAARSDCEAFAIGQRSV